MTTAIQHFNATARELTKSQFLVLLPVHWILFVRIGTEKKKTTNVVEKEIQKCKGVKS